MKRVLFFGALCASLVSHAQTWDLVDSIQVNDAVWDKPKVDVSSSDDIFVSFQTKNNTNPLVRSSDGGQTWTVVKQRFQRGYIGFDSQDRMYVVSEKKYSNVATTYLDSLYYSTDMGTTLQVVDEVPDNDWDRSSFHIDGNDNFYSSGSGSGPNYAREWLLYNGGTQTSSMYGPFDVFSSGQRSIAVLSDGTIVVSSYNSGVRYSTDGGTTWVESQNDAALGNSTWVAFAEANNGDLFLGGASLAESTDGGETWAISTLGQNFIDPVVKGSNGRLYAMAVYNTLFASDDNGATWTAIANTPSGTYSSMAVSDNYVYIIINNVLYRTAVTGGSSGIGLTEIEQNSLNIYPNPSAGDVHIALPEGEMSQVSVYNISGSLVYHSGINSGEVILSREDFPSAGVYTVQVLNSAGTNMHIGRVVIQ